MDEDYGLDWSGYDAGDSGYVEPFNYEPEGYQDPAWNTPEHYSYEAPPSEEPFNYEPGIYNGEASVDTTINDNPSSLFDGFTPDNGGDNSMLSKWADKGSGSGSGDGLKSLSRSGGSRDESSLRKYLMSTAQTNTQTKKFNREMPTFEGASLTLPDWDSERIRRLRQLKANYGVSSLRGETDRALTLSRSSQTGYGARQALREALAGYGKGLSSVMKEADSEAGAEYGREFAGKTNKAQQEYNAKYQVANIMYQAALQAYLNDFTVTNQSITNNSYA